MPGHPLTRLTRLFAAQANGHDLEPHGTPSPQLSDRWWEYRCRCGDTFRWRGTAVWRLGAWRSPRRQCRACFAWTDGHVSE